VIVKPSQIKNQTTPMAKPPQMTVTNPNLVPKQTVTQKTPNVVTGTKGPSVSNSAQAPTPNVVTGTKGPSVSNSAQAPTPNVVTGTKGPSVSNSAQVPTPNNGYQHHTQNAQNTSVQKSGFVDSVKSFFGFGKVEGKNDQVMEPGIRNKEVETYRTNDKKEILHKDAIIQDDKNVTLPKKHLK